MARFYYNERNDLFIDQVDFKRTVREYHKLHSTLTRDQALNQVAVLFDRTGHRDLLQAAKVSLDTADTTPTLEEQVTFHREGWLRLTQALRDQQALHLDHHKGDVYHTCQSLASKYGLRQPVRLCEPLSSSESTHGTATQAE